jgi:hypothetical protein
MNSNISSEQPLTSEVETELKPSFPVDFKCKYCDQHEFPFIPLDDWKLGLNLYYTLILPLEQWVKENKWNRQYANSVIGKCEYFPQIFDVNKYSSEMIMTREGIVEDGHSGLILYKITDGDPSTTNINYSKNNKDIASELKQSAVNEYLQNSMPDDNGEIPTKTLEECAQMADRLQVLSEDVDDTKEGPKKDTDIDGLAMVFGCEKDCRLYTYRSISYRYANKIEDAMPKNWDKNPFGQNLNLDNFKDMTSWLFYARKKTDASDPSTMQVIGWNNKSYCLFLTAPVKKETISPI